MLLLRHSNYRPCIRILSSCSVTKVSKNTARAPPSGISQHVHHIQTPHHQPTTHQNQHQPNEHHHTIDSKWKCIAPTSRSETETTPNPPLIVAAMKVFGMQVLLLLVLLPSTTALSSHACAHPGRGVCDPDGLLSVRGAKKLTAQIVQLEEQFPHDCGDVRRGFQVAVHIIQRLPHGTEVGDHARDLFNRHGVGYRPCNNGLLLLLAVGDRKSAIRTGKGTQRVVTDGMIDDMLAATTFKQQMRAHDYAGGAQYILDQIIGPLQSNEPTVYYKRQHALQVSKRVLCWGLALGAFCLLLFPLAKVSLNIPTAVDGTAVAVVSTLVATEMVSTVSVGVLACLRFALFVRYEDKRKMDLHARAEDFRAKLQQLQDTRERNAKRDVDVTTAPCAICLEELPKGLNFSQSACSSGDGPPSDTTKRTKQQAKRARKSAKRARKSAERVLLRENVFDESVKNDVKVVAEILRCGHVFHEECIDTWVNSGGNDGCPICRKKSPRFTTAAGGSRAVGGSTARGGSAAGSGDGPAYSRTRPAPVDDEYYGVYYRSLGRRYRDVPGAVRMHQRNPTWSSYNQRLEKGDVRWIGVTRVVTSGNLCTDYAASEAAFRREQEAIAARERWGRSSTGGGYSDCDCDYDSGPDW